MAFTAEQCQKFSSFLFRRVPDWDKMLAKDRYPRNFVYTNMYRTKTWESGTGTSHTWDRVSVAAPNDDGCWDAIDIGACVTNICDPSRKTLGWGSVRANYGKYHRDYDTPVLCLDQLRDTEEAVAQLNAIVEGLKDVPDDIISGFIRMLSLRQSNKIFIVNAAQTEITTTAGMFQANCTKIDLGSAANLPTGKLTMEFLDNHVEELMMQGYHDREWLPGGKFAITTDLQTQRDLTNGNPALAAFFRTDDWVKGGTYYKYGLVGGAGNWVFKNDPDQLRFQHIGNGVLQRIQPYTNEAATVGIQRRYSSAYKNAQYALYHVYNADAREVYVGDVTSVNDEMKFGLARDLMGKWSWKSPDVIISTDPTTGVQCTLRNDKKNKGYFLGEYEMGTKTIYPEIEMWILAEREPQPYSIIPRAATAPSMVYQNLLAYNPHCDPQGEES